MIDRIIQLIESLGITQIEFCKKTNINPVSLSTTKIRSSDMKETSIVAIMKAYPDINIKWLLMGDGQMWERDKGSQLSIQHTENNGYINQSIGNSPDCERQLIKLQAELLDAQRKIIELLTNRDRV